MERHRLVAAAALAGILAAATVSRAAPPAGYAARVLRAGDPGRTISTLAFDSDEFDVSIAPEGADLQSVRVSARMTDPGWNLIRGKEWLSREADDEGRFSFEVPLEGEITALDLVSVGPLGQVEHEKTYLRIPEDWAGRLEEARLSEGRRSEAVASLGYSVIRYRESGIPDLALHALTAKASYRYVLFPPSWNVAVSAYVTAVPLNEAIDGVSARFLGANARLGYVFPGIRRPWRLGLFGGWYYVTMSVDGRRFGFRNLSGPQAYPAVERELDNGDVLSGYLKFSPMTDRFRILALSNRELALGAAWRRPLGNGRAFSVAMDVANLKVEIEGVRIDSTSFSLSAGYGF